VNLLFQFTHKHPKVLATATAILCALAFLNIDSVIPQERMSEDAVLKPEFVSQSLAVTRLRPALRSDSALMEKEGDLFNQGRTTALPNQVTGAQQWRWPIHATLKDALPNLQRLAESGEPRAGCMLAGALLRCRAIKRMGARYRRNLLNAELQSLDRRELELADAYAANTAQLNSSEKFCRSVDDSVLASADKLLLDAAQRGQRESMYKFVEGEFLQFKEYQFLAKPEFKTWQEQAPVMAQLMLRKGYPEIVPMLALAYETKDSPFAALIADDPYQARVMAHLQELLFAEPAGVGVLESNAERQARDAARDIWQKSFRNSRHALERSFGPPSDSHWSPDSACPA
jgi:hypothetical protein